MVTAETLTERAPKLIEQEGGFVAFVQNVGMGSIFLAIVYQIIDGIQSFGTILLGPPRALGHGMIDLVEVVIGGMLSVMDAGTRTTVESFLSGTASLLGPFAQPASVGIMMITIAVFIYSINRLDISPLSFVQNLRD